MTASVYEIKKNNLINLEYGNKLDYLIDIGMRIFDINKKNRFL